MKKQSIILAAFLFFVLWTVGCGNNVEDEGELYDYDLSEYIELGQYKGVEIPDISDEEVDKEIENRLAGSAISEDLTEGVVQEGDTVNIDYVGTKDGIPFEGGTSNGYDLTIGSGDFVPGFEDGLVGEKIGDTATLNLTFPENYYEELAGQAVVFEVKINSVKRPVKALFDEEFIKANSDYETIPDYKDSVKKDLANALVAEDIVWEKVANEATVLKYPEKELEKMRDEVTQYYKDIAGSEGKKWEDLLEQDINMTQEEFDARVEDDVRQQIKLEMVICAISRQEGLEISDEEYNDGKKEYLTSIGYTSEKEYKKDMGKGFEENVGGRNSFEIYLLYKKVVAFLVENAVFPQ